MRIFTSNGFGRVVAFALAALASVVASVQAVPPPAEGWREQVGVTGVGGTYTYTVGAMQIFDEDGEGPRPPYLIAGGSFTVAGNTAANSIAAYDGKSWRALGAGFDADVYTLATFNGELIAAGAFTTSGSTAVSRIARWTAGGWQPLGSGLNGPVRVLQVYNGRLYAGGEFTAAGSVTTRRIAVWDGRTWSAVGSGIGTAGDSSVVRAMTVHNGVLAVGGLFTSAGGVSVTNLATCNGTTWAAQSATGLPGAVHCLAVYNGTLYAGGAFDGTVSGLPLRFIARFISGLWRPVGAGAAGGIDSDGLPYSGAMNAMLVRNGQLIVVGDFKYVLDYKGNQLDARRVAAWDGARWYQAGTVPGVDYIAESVADFAGQLVVGGRFERAGGIWVRGIAATDGVTWNSLTSGISNRVLSLTTYNGKLIAGGPFASIGGITTNSIASWDGTSWQTLGTGITGRVPQVYAVQSYNGSLVAAGYFEFAGGVPVTNVARWNGSTWSAMGLGLDGIVRVLAVWFDPVRGQSSLYAGGDFRFSGSTAVNKIARWDEATQTWQPVGGGVLNDPVVPDATGVFCLQGYLGRLYVGGFLGGGGTVASRYLVTWDGANWSTPPAGTVNNEVRGMTIFDGQLVITGYFRMFINNQWYNYIASWDGVLPTWSRLGEGLNEGATELTLFNGQLIVGGSFTGSGSQTGINRIARWDGTSFSPMGTGLDTLPNAMASYDPDGIGPRVPVLAVGGEFGTAGGRVSPFFAMWGPLSDSIWNATTGGDGSLAFNWLYGATPNAFQNAIFDSSLSSVPLVPQYRVTLSAPVTARRMTVNTNQVTLDLSGREFMLNGPASDFDPPLTVGRRAGAGTDTRLVLSNTGAAATFHSAGAIIGNVTDSALSSQLIAKDANLTAQIDGNVAIGSLSRGTLEVSGGATFRYGADALSFLGAGFFAAPTTSPNATINVLSGGRLESARPARVVSIASAMGSRAQVLINGAGSRWTAQQADLFIGDLGNASLTLSGGGELVTSSTNSVIVGRLGTSTASVTINAGSRWQETTRDIAIGGGGGGSRALVRVLSTGVLEAPAINLLPGGELGGTGTVIGDVYNFGVIDPGGAGTITPGTLTINGSYRQFGVNGDQTGTVVLNVASATPGTGYDRLVINGAAELAGGLRVVFDPVFTPPPTLNLELIEATSFTTTAQSTFDVAVLPALIDGRFLRLDYAGGTGRGANAVVRLTAAPLGGSVDIGAPQTAGVGGSPTSAVVADFNRDGADDLAITVPAVNATGSAGAVVVLFSAGHDANNNWLGFASQQTVAVQNEPLGLDVGDLNGDGRPDLAVANASSNSISVLLNSGGSTIFPSAITVPNVGQRPVAVAVANFNVDPVGAETLPEIAVACRDSDEVRFIESSGGGTTFAQVTGSAVVLGPGTSPTALVAFDPDQDKNLRRRRVAVTGERAGLVIPINNTGASARSPLAMAAGAPIPVGPGPMQVIATNLRPGAGQAPVPLVGNADLVVRNGDGTLSVLIGDTQAPNALATFRPAVSVPVSTSVLSITVLDIDSDGDPDLAALTPGGSDTTVQIIRNDYLARDRNNVISQSNAQPVLVPNAVPPLVGGALAKIVVSGRLSGVTGNPADLVTIADPPGSILRAGGDDQALIARGSAGDSLRRDALSNVRGFPNRRTSSSSCNPADLCGVGATYSNGAVDIGPDGTLTIEDFLNFLSAFGDAAGCPGAVGGAGPCNPADVCGIGATYSGGIVDVGPDAELTIEDFLVFLTAFGDSSGCP